MDFVASDAQTYTQGQQVFKPVFVSVVGPIATSSVGKPTPCRRNVAIGRLDFLQKKASIQLPDVSVFILIGHNYRKEVFETKRNFSVIC